MELACMAGFITPRTVCAGGTYVKPKSGLHVEELPGISWAALAAVEPGKYLNAQTFIDEKLETAGKMIVDRIRATLSQYVEEAGPKEAGFIGTWSEDYLAGVATKVGVRVRTDGGAMLRSIISRVWIWSEDDIADLVVKVKDGPNECEWTVSVVGGEETEVWLNYQAKTVKVDVYVEDVRFKPRTGDAQGTAYFSNCTGCSSHGRYRGIAGGGLSGETESATLRGIKPEVVLICSIDPVVCILLKHFRFAVLWQFGCLVLQEWIASPRTNYFTIHSKEWAAATLEMWMTIELPRAMKDPTKYLAHFISQLDPGCLICGEGANYSHAHP